MSVEPLNTIPLQQFLNLVKSADASRQKEIRMDMTQARTLALTLGSVMARLEGDLEKFVEEQIKKIQDEQVITVSLGGSSDWN